MNQSPFEFCPSPQAEGAERALLCAMMMDDGGSVCAHCRTTLAGPEDFSSPRHAALYETIMRLHADGAGTDPVSVKTALQRRSLWDQVSGDEGNEYLVALHDEVASIHSAPHHAQIIRVEAARRDEMLAGAKRQVELAQGATPTRVLAEQDPEIIPVESDTLPELPLDCLPPWMREHVQALSEAKEVSPTFGAPLALAASAGACQKQYVVRVEVSYSEPLALFASPAMEPGERKTAVQRPLLAPLHDLQRELIEESREEAKKTERKRKLLEKRIGKLHRDYEKAEDDTERADIEREVAEVEAQIPPPAHTPQLATESFSEAALVDALARNGEVMLVASDEGGLFDELAGRHSEGPEIDLVLKAHTGSPYTSNRVSRGIVNLRRPLISIAISPQPDVLRTLGKKEGFIGRGLTARFIWTLPTSKVGRRNLNPGRIPQAVQSEYAYRLKALGRAAWKHTGDPLEITLTLEAHAIWKQFERELEPRMAKGADLTGPIRGWASKLPGLVARIAGVCHVGNCPAGHASINPIPLETMAGAVAFGIALIPHAQEVHRLFGGTARSVAGEVVRRYTVEGWPTGAQSATKWWRPVRQVVGESAKDFLPVAQQLEDAGYLIQVESPTRNGQGKFWRANHRLF